MCVNELGTQGRAQTTGSVGLGGFLSPLCPHHVKHRRRYVLSQWQPWESVPGLSQMCPATSSYLRLEVGSARMADLNKPGFIPIQPSKSVSSLSRDCVFLPTEQEQIVIVCL